MDLERFLRCLFPYGPGFIEVRVIEDKKPGKLVKRGWYPRVDDLLADLPALRLLADQWKAAIFFGVLSRREPGKGKAEDIIASFVVWVDLDFKDFAGGEAEARKRLTEFPVKPSIVVRSGHGLHAYWIMREPTAPDELSAISRGLAHVLGGDHTFDAARILRMPGTNNWKDPEHPILVEIESLEPERAFNPDELKEAVEMCGGNCAAPPSTSPPSETQIEGPLHPKLLALIQRHPRLRGLYEGTGKPEFDDDGRPLDRTSSGYDYSFVLALGRKGILDKDLLANALWNRPDQAAQAKGLDYIRRTVERAIARYQTLQEEVEEYKPDFQVEKVWIHDSDPPIYELQIDGKPVRLSSEELKTSSKFSTKFMNAHRRIPSVPQSEDEWHDTVNGWLATAELVEQPPEASQEFALREAVEGVVAGLPVGESAVDLDHGKAALIDGQRFFKTDAVLKVLREDEWSGIDRSEVCRVLKALEYRSSTRKVGDGQARGWIRP
jgi:hypothetical protein